MGKENVRKWCETLDLFVNILAGPRKAWRQATHAGVSGGHEHMWAHGFGCSH